MVTQLRRQPKEWLHCRAESIDKRHRHRGGYLSIVLEGEEIEAGDEGRRRVRQGDILVHRPFDAHCNYVGTRGAKILNLPWPDGFDLPSMGHLADVDAIVRLAERDGFEASVAAANTMTARLDQLGDWPDLLAKSLRSLEDFSLRKWADGARLATETVSRGFKKVYDVSPVRYRLEYRARTAWRQTIDTRYPLAEIASVCGFADQSHMCRGIRAVTGHSPSSWRTHMSKSFKTSAAISR